MENVLSIISEYNPFHFGHLFQLEESIKQVNPKYKVAIISGNFVQRGEPSILNKWEKTKIALFYGFDLVIELPTIYSISSAENFAHGAMKIAHSIGTTHISFGSENGNIDDLKGLSNLINNSPIFINKVKEKISEGFSYPKSQELVIEELFSDKYKNICTPNNILGLEYLKSIEKLNSNIVPITVKRNNEYYSSSQIRENLRNDISFDGFVPEYTKQIINENLSNGHIVKSIKQYEKEIIYTIRKMSFEDLTDIPDLSENLVKKFKNAASSCNTIEDLISNIKNKSITQARIQRILLYILLDIKKSDMEISKSVTPYIRILGLNSKGKELLSSISKRNYNIITSVNKFEEDCTNARLLRLLDIDKLSTDIYTLAYSNNSACNLDYTTKLIELI